MDIKGAEIFATGKWNTLEFDERDLDAIVENFEKLKEIHHVPLKLGHNKEQKVTDGQPALGWVKRIYRQGQKLLADFVDMPKVIHDAVKKRLYRTVSIELLFNVDHDGNKYNQVLDAVALLGADHPAVNTLADLQMLTAARTEFSGGRRVSFETLAGTKTEEIELDKKEVQELIASAVKPLEDANEELRKENKTLKDTLEERDRREAEFARKKKEQEVRDHRDAVTKLLDDAVRARRIAPAFRETYSKQIGLSDDERVLEIDLDDVKQVCKFTRGTDNQEHGMQHDGNDSHDEESAEEELLLLTRQSMEADETFEAAFMRTAAAYPKLHKAYLDANGVKGGE